ncbi:MAG: TIGR04552 family protein [Anaeromyxobacter sp.]|nr:TIGR04552 family protein [Anaeromyxobacter sp.]MBL0276261.1 TIGR04552 family protein [Anaeromyxobacter sp.]
MGLADLEALRLLLRGGSVIDWRRLEFTSPAEVDAFLRLNLFDLEEARDERRLRMVLSQSVDYLRSAFGYRVADVVANPEDLRHLFLWASGVLEPRKLRRIACVVLKVMHVIHHLEARELLFRTPIREADLAERVHRRVMAEAERMRALGLPVVEFRGNVKTRESLVTKLLAKKESVAAQVFDRVRYRVVTERPEQIPPVVLHLTRHLFPFNYAVPGQVQNSLLRFGELLARHPRGAELAAELQLPLHAEKKDPAAPRNDFSADTFKVLNFVVDVPVRIDELLPPLDPMADELGSVVFSLVEFQVIDAETARRNEEGDASHERYKRRQQQQVLRRLSRGLVVPKKQKARKAKAKARVKAKAKG